jgi:hypothetical protein
MDAALAARWALWRTAVGVIERWDRQLLVLGVDDELEAAHVTTVTNARTWCDFGLTVTDWNSTCGTAPGHRNGKPIEGMTEG